MPAVTLITDWNNYDYYLAAFKGKLISLDVKEPLIEISHQIAAHNIPQVSFLLQQSYPFFPEGSVHVIAVASQPEPGCNYLLTCAHGHYFLSADNAIISIIFPDDDDVTYYEIIPQTKTLFPEIDIFAPVAAQLLSGAKPENIGTQTKKIKRLNALLPMFYPDSIEGHVLYIDSYGNAISNITKADFEKIGKGRKFEIHVLSFHYKINTISETYHVEKGEFVALFNQLQLLEVAQAQGSIATLLNIKVGSRIIIRFNNESANLLMN